MFDSKSFQKLRKTAPFILFLLTAIFTLIFFQNYHQTIKDAHFISYENIANNFAVSPRSFEMNNGQVNDHVKFLSRGEGYSLFLTESEAVLKLKCEKDKNLIRSCETSYVLNMKIIGSNSDPIIKGLDELSGKSNYLIGNDKNKWRTDIPNYAKVQYQNIYSGIDLVYYGNQKHLEYDFIVSPEVDPNIIKLGFEGAKEIIIDDSKNLTLVTDGGNVILKSPNIYQQQDNIMQKIVGEYELDDNLQVCFNVGHYDKSIPLIIDPELVYSSYLGGSDADGASGISLDAQGNVYITGETASSDFPTVNPFQANFKSGGSDVFVTKLNNDGTELIYSTYLGGESWDYAAEIGVDNDAQAIVTGTTASENFPVRAAVQAQLADSTEMFMDDGDVFVAKLNPQGNGLVYSTYLGSWEDEFVFDLDVTEEGYAYVTGYTNSTLGNDDGVESVFPLTTGSYSDIMPENVVGQQFVTSLNPSGSLKYSTLLGDLDYMSGNSISVNSIGTAYILRSGYSETCVNGEITIIVLNSSGTAIIDSVPKCISGEVYSAALDSKNNIYVCGDTYLTQVVGSFPVTGNAFQSSFGGGYQDGFLLKLSPQWDIPYLSYFGGNEWDHLADLYVADDDIVYLTGYTKSVDFPLKNAVQQEFGGGEDVIVSQFDLSSSGSESLIYSSFLGGGEEDNGYGIAVDPTGNVYITGTTTSSDFPLINSYQSTINGSGDAFVCKIGSGVVNLIYDKVVIGGPPVFPLLLPSATQQILPQYLINGVSDILIFTFLGERTDSRVGLRVTNTSFGFAPLYLNLSVTDPENVPVPPFTIHNTGIGNAGIQFDVLKEGIYTVKVWCESNSPGPFPSPFQIHLAGNVGDPRKRIFPAGEDPYYEDERATRQDILVNHPAPRPQLLLGDEVLHSDNKVAQTALFKFTNIAEVSQNAVAVLIPTTDLGFPLGSAPVRAIDPNPVIDITTPTATTPQIVNPPRSTVIDFTQVPIPTSLDIPLQLGVAAVLGIRDQISIALPFTNNTGEVYTIILDMGSGQEIVDGEGSDFRIYAEGSYNIAVSNTPFQDTFIPIGSTVTGNNEFELASSGLTSVRYVRLNAQPSVSVDAIRALNVFADEVREDLGAFSKVSNATITMRRSKAPETPIDPFLELIAPDGALMAKNESGFGDDISTVLSDAALINMELNQEGFYRYLGRGYDVRPEESSIGSFYTRLESAGKYDQIEISLSNSNESSTSPQKEGHIVNTRQRDSYIFQASPGQLVNIAVTAKDDGLNPMVELYDPEDFLIGANDDVTGRGRNSLLSVTLPTKSFVGQSDLPNPSTYRIVVSAIDLKGSRSPVDERYAYFRIAPNGEYDLKVFTILTDINQDEELFQLPEIYELKQNYPNPLNPSTTIKYSIPKQSRVMLTVFDVLGREIETIVNKGQSPGNYEVEFDGKDLTSGIYFYRLQVYTSGRAGDSESSSGHVFVDTKKMILLK
jgi:Beta-propeller repeat/Secretion system C-terminal sorting domain